MIENFNENSEKLRDYNSEFLLKILNNTSIKTTNSDDKEIFVDENWKINSKNINKKILYKNSNLKRILSEIFPNKQISIRDNYDRSQTIYIS